MHIKELNSVDIIKSSKLLFYIPNRDKTPTNGYLSENVQK